MKLLTACILALGCAIPFRATIVVVEFTPERMIVAADSLALTPDQASTDACKIIQLDAKTFFFATGQVRAKASNGAEWNATNFARDSFAGSKLIIDKFTLSRVAAQWAELMRESLKGLQAAINTNITEGVFGSVDALGIHAHQVSMVRMVVPGAISPQIVAYSANIYDRTNPIAAFGVNASFPLVVEFLANVTPRAKILNRKLGEKIKSMPEPQRKAERIGAAVEAAIAWMPKKNIIGGSVDLMILNRGASIEWIRRKPNCPEN